MALVSKAMVTNQTVGRAGNMNERSRLLKSVGTWRANMQVEQMEAIQRHAIILKFHFSKEV